VSGLLVPLGIGRRDVVAAVGAGGKTTLLYSIAREARTAGWTVLVTTTTHMGPRSDALAGPVLVEADGHSDRDVGDALAAHGIATILGRRLREDKLQGLSPEHVDRLAPLADLTLVEADGARGRSLKAPAGHEPVVPSSCTALLVLAALDVLGTGVDGDLVHRPEIVSRLAGLDAGAPVTEDAFVAALTHPESYPSRAAAGMRALVFLNKVEDEAARAAAGRLAPRLVPPFDGVVAGSARAGRSAVDRLC
jgi:probable selenium-dependent hydroxylase accessory protein YqeC